MKSVDTKKIIIGFIAVIIVLSVVGFVIFNKSGNNSSKNVSNTVVATMTPSPTPRSNETVMVSVHGFVPATLQVKIGTFINFANFSENAIDVVFDSAPDKSLTIGKIEAGDTSDPRPYSVSGEYIYHNAVISDQKGKIVVGE